MTKRDLEDGAAAPAKEGRDHGGEDNGESSSSSPATPSVDSPVLRIGAILLAVFAGVGLLLGLILFGIIYFVPRTYSNPATGSVAMWGGISCAWCLSPLAVWWLAPFFNQHHTRCGHMFAMVLEIIFVVFGLLAFCGWAACAFEAGSAVAPLLLWVCPGGLAAYMSFSQVRRESICVSPEPKGSDAAPKRAGCCCKCNGRVALLTLGTVVILAGLLFAGGLAVTGVATAADEAANPMLGQLVEVSLAPADGSATLHIFCNGTSAAGKPTIVLAHGGGSNSVAMVGLQQEFVTQHGFRACVYDRLGYGWTQTFVAQNSLNDFPDTGEVLSRLLAAAGEPGPFACVGHSMGASVCARFAVHDPKVEAVVGLDGYPDVIRAGMFRPGLYDPNSPGPAVLPVAFFTGAPGLTRGIVGGAGPDFVPYDLRSAYTYLYGQERFWLAQYWDVKADSGSTDGAAYVYALVPGAYQNQTSGFVDYNKPLSSNVTVLWIPAKTTVNTTCNDEYEYNDYCCGEYGAPTDICKNNVADSSFYLEQAELYATTLGKSEGHVVVGPDGSAHGFAYEAEFVPWICSTVSSYIV